MEQGILYCAPEFKNLQMFNLRINNMFVLRSTIGGARLPTLLTMIEKI